MKTSVKPIGLWVGIGVGVFVLTGALIMNPTWLPLIQSQIRTMISSQKVGISGEDAASEQQGHDHSDQEEHAHAGHSHGHDNANSLELSIQAQGNLGLRNDSLQPIRLETFQRTMTVPGIIVERPGRSRIEVSTPMAGVITNIHAVEGEAIKPGDPLFDLRITAEELVESQTELLKTVGDLDVENREIVRLTKVTESGAIPQKALLDRQYAKNKLENLLLAQREALRLHGFSDQQIEEIVANRRLFRDLRIIAPRPGDPSHEIQLSRSDTIPISYAKQPPIAKNAPDSSLWIITMLPVHIGQTVAAGATLAEIADYSMLYIEGRTFERDAKVLSRLSENKWKIAALFEGAGGERLSVPDLELVYSGAAIQVESRTLPFYVGLPNEMIRRAPSPTGHEFVEWRYRPGQRLQLLVPIEELKDQIVLPVEAIAREGAESYVFQQNGDHFDRVAVHIKYRDAVHAVIANDGSIFPGDIVARLGAHQMQMALKNKSGGGVDPHAGHNH